VRHACLIVAADALVRQEAHALDVVVAAAVGAGCAPIIAVVPPGTKVPDESRAAVDASSVGDPVRSLRLGLAQLANTGVAGVLLWPADRARVLGETARALCEAAERSAAPIVVPTYEGRRGHPVYFARATWRELMTVRAGGAQAVVDAYAERVHELVVDDPGVVGTGVRSQEPGAGAQGVA
jgi:CTP:molybdopterin cytidylyltransferase MocA